MDERRVVIFPSIIKVQTASVLTPQEGLKPLGHLLNPTSTSHVDKTHSVVLTIVIYSFNYIDHIKY